MTKIQSNNATRCRCFVTEHIFIFLQNLLIGYVQEILQLYLLNGTQEALIYRNAAPGTKSSNPT